MYNIAAKAAALVAAAQGSPASWSHLRQYATTHGQLKLILVEVRWAS